MSSLSLHLIDHCLDETTLNVGGHKSCCDKTASVLEAAADCMQMYLALGTPPSSGYVLFIALPSSMHKLARQDVMDRTLGLLHNLGDGCRHQNRVATAVAAGPNGREALGCTGLACARPWRQLSRHGDSRRGMATPRDIATASPRRHSSPFGDTHRHLATILFVIALATPVAKWRWVSPYGDGCRQGRDKQNRPIVIL